MVEQREKNCRFKKKIDLRFKKKFRFIIIIIIFFGIGTQFFKLKKLFFLLNLIKLMFIYFKISDLDFCFNFY